MKCNVLIEEKKRNSISVLSSCAGSYHTHVGWPGAKRAWQTLSLAFLYDKVKQTAQRSSTIRCFRKPSIIFYVQNIIKRLKLTPANNINPFVILSFPIYSLILLRSLQNNLEFVLSCDLTLDLHE